MEKERKPQSLLEMEGYKQRTKGIAKRVQHITVSAIKEIFILAIQYEDVVSFG